MKKITFKKDNIIRKIGEGKESEVFLYKEDNGQISCLKLFKDQIKFYKDLINEPEIINLTDKMRSDKEDKLDIISKTRVLNDDAKLISLVYDSNGKFIGYTREFIKNIKTMDQFTDIKNNNKLELLYSLRDKMEFLNKHDIYIGDFNDKNFYVENNEVKLLDVDSFKVDDIDFGVKNYIMNKYLDSNEDISNIDNFCYNFYSLGFYCKNACIYEYLKDNGLPRKFRTKENKKIYETLYNPKTYKKKYLIDHVKEGLF